MRLYPPGARRKKRDGKVYSNATYVVRLTHRKRQHEIVTDATDAQGAKEFAIAFLGSIAAGNDDAGSFRDIARQYMEAEKRSDATLTYLEKLLEARWLDGGQVVGLADIAIEDVRASHLYRAAKALHPDAKNATRNRNVIRPAAAVLHFAAESDIIPWRRIKLLTEDEADVPVASDAMMQQILGDRARQFSPDLWMVNMVLFGQGSRISETLALRWDYEDGREGDIRLADQVIRYRVKKGRPARWRDTIAAMNEGVFSLLANIPQEDRTGRVFAYRDRYAYRAALDDLNEFLGIRFSPHMARHWFGTTLGRAQVTDIGIANAGTWTSARSTHRYQRNTVEDGRNHLKLVHIGGNHGGKGAK